jgi:hypothetical protein
MSSNTAFDDDVKQANQPQSQPVASPAAAAPAGPAPSGSGTVFDDDAQTHAAQYKQPTSQNGEGTISAYTPTVWDRVEHMFRASSPNTRPLVQDRAEGREHSDMTIISPQEYHNEREKSEHPMETAFGEFVSDMTTPENILQLIATEGLGAATPFLKGGMKIVPRLISAGFSGQMLQSAYKQYPAVKAAFAKGDVNEVERLLTHITLTVGMAALAGQHAAKGGEAVSKPTQYEDAQSKVRQNESEEFFPTQANSNNQNPYAPKEKGTVAGPRTNVRPTTVKTAGVEAPIAAAQQANAPLAARLAGHLASPGAAKDFQQTRTVPAASRQLVSTLGQRLEDVNNAHNALVDGEEKPEALAGTQQPSQYQTIDDAVRASKQTVKKTWDRADDIDSREQKAWEQQRDAAVSEHKQLLDEHNQNVTEHNSNLAKGETPMEPMAYDQNQVSIPEKPRTLAELRSAEQEAWTNAKSSDAAIRQQAYDKDLPKAEKDLDNWFKKHEDEISPEEWNSAKNVYRTASRMQDIANSLRAPMLKASETGGGLTGNTLRAIEARINNQAVRRGQTPDAFRKLLGPEAYDNWKNVSRVLDPVKGPSKIEQGLEYFASAFLGHLAPLGFAGKAMTEFLMNRVLFHPEWGKWFTNFFGRFKQTGAIAPEAQDEFTRLMKNTKMSNQELLDAGYTQAQIDRGIHLPGVGGGSASTVSLPTMNQFDAHMQNGGSTFSEGKDMSGADMHAVGSYPERTEQIGQNFSPEHIEYFKSKNQDLLSRPNHAVGTWQDPDTGMHTLDVSQLIPDREAAISAGRAANQKSIYHLKSGELIDTGGTGEAPKKTMQMHHWSNKEGLTETDPEQMGTGGFGAERVRFDEPGFPKRTYFGLEGFQEPRVQGRKFHYVADVDPARYYDAQEDPEGIWQQGFQEGGATEAEKAVKNAGYAGYRVGDTAASFDKVPVRLHEPTVGSQAGAKADTDFMAQAKKNLPNGTLSQQLLEAQRLKDTRNEPVKHYPDQGFGKETNVPAPAKTQSDSQVTHYPDPRFGKEIGVPAPATKAPTPPSMLPPEPENKASLENKEITTRRPTSVSGDLANNPNQHANMDAVHQAGAARPTRVTENGNTVMGYKEKMARTVAAYTGVRYTPEELNNPDKVIGKFINRTADNLEWLYNQVPEPLRAKTRQWYDSAHEITKQLANQYGFTHEQAAAVTAALSPQNPWDNNVGLAKRMMDIYHNRQNFDFTPEMERKVADLKKVPTQSKAFKGLLKDVAGKKLSDFKDTDPDVRAVKQALWVRLYDEAHNSEVNDQYAPTGEVMGHSPDNRSWIGLDHMAKAVKILNDGSIDAINSNMGFGHKIRNFYNNIINPNSNNGHVTVDSHAVAASHLQPFGAKDVEAQHSFGNTAPGIPGAPKDAATGLRGTYPLYAEAYQRVAKKMGVLPRELQSVAWEAIKSLMGDSKKTPELKARTREIWQDVQDGKLTPNKARDMIKSEANGFSKPVWMSDEEWEKTAEDKDAGDADGFNVADFSKAQPQMSVGSGDYQMTANRAADNPSLNEKIAKWKGQPQPMPSFDANERPTMASLSDMADHANANTTDDAIMYAAAHELAHGYLQHHHGISTEDMKIVLGHTPVRRGEMTAAGGVAPIDGVAGGIASPGQGWQTAIDNATGRERRNLILQYVSQTMAGRAAEELLGQNPAAIKLSIAADEGMARDVLQHLLHVPESLHDQYLKDAAADAKSVLKENFGTFRHMVQQAVNHWGGDVIDSGTFHKYRLGGHHGKG